MKKLLRNVLHEIVSLFYNPEPPLYVWFGKKGSCAMRLKKNEYWRDAGVWGSNFNRIGFFWYATGHFGEHEFLNGQRLYPCTEAEWRECNKYYISDSTKAFREYKDIVESKEIPY